MCMPSSEPCRAASASPSSFGSRSGGLCSFEELRDSRDNLAEPERLLDKHAVGHRLRYPLVRCSTGDVDDRKYWVYLPHRPGNIPTAQPAAQVYIGYKD